MRVRLRPPDALARLRLRLPQVHVQLSEDNVPNLWRQLEAGEFDAIVCRLPVLSEQQRLPAGVAHRRTRPSFPRKRGSSVVLDAGPSLTQGYTRWHC